MSLRRVLLFFIWIFVFNCAFCFVSPLPGLTAEIHLKNGESIKGDLIIFLPSISIVHPPHQARRFISPDSIAELITNNQGILELSTGERLIGKITVTGKASLTIQSPLLGNLVFEKSKISKISEDQGIIPDNQLAMIQAKGIEEDSAIEKSDKKNKRVDTTNWCRAR